MTSKHQISERLAALRHEMAADGLQAIIVPQLDPHQSEYLAAHWQARRYFSGFTGSAGTLVVTADAALLWTDSRYFLQAAQQLEGTGIELMKEDIPGVPTMAAWLTHNLKAGDVVGVDGMLYSATAAANLEKALAKHGIALNTSVDPVGRAWNERPDLPLDRILIHELKYAGQPASEKIAEIMADAAEQDAQSALLCALDEIAWTLNIRGRDVNCNPVATSFLYLDGKKGGILFIDTRKVDAAAAKYLADNNIAIKEYRDLLPTLAALPADEKVLVQMGRTPKLIVDTLGGRAVAGESIVAFPKARKNDVQVAGIRAAMERDGVALIRSVMEIQKRLREGVATTELDVVDSLLRNRQVLPLFFDISFGTIAGYAGHGAIVHYEPTPESNATLEPRGLLLIDSGAQYYDGTTDITRTIALGTPTPEEKRDFTLVMKGHIALGLATFPQGTRGDQLDVLARQFLWANGLSYLHGTGHGVGHFLNVHEGPQSVRLNHMPATLQPGMIISNEPGLYRENIHGIRCENLVLVHEKMETEFGKFYGFETLTLFPFDLNLFDVDIMTDEEIGWVNDYHTMVRERLLPLLDNAAERDWLITATGTLTR